MVQRSGVLIETYWNVNFDGCNALCIGKIVLIETYWNVNLKKAFEKTEPKIGINRNILECKRIQAEDNVGF